MLRKMLSMLLVMLMLLSISVTFVSAEDSSGAEAPIVPSYDEPSTADGVSSFDEAYTYLISVIESAETINRNYYTDESFEVFSAALSEACFARINASEDMYTAEELALFADNLWKSCENLEYLIFGDSNGDRKVNIKDATEIQKHLANLVNLSEKRLLCADINSDGVNNIKDATFLQKFLSGIITPCEIEYIELDFYIIDLKIELFELMEYAELYTTGTQFEEEGYERYEIAMENAVSAYRSKWPLEENAQDVLDAINELKDALHNLVVELPEVLPTDGEIEYLCDYEFRVGPYDYDWKNVNVIVRSREELQAELEKTDVNAYEKNDDIFHEKYDDAFFEENAIIMSFCMVGGSGCSQWVYSLEIDGTALIVHRSVHRPEIYPPDMNYSLSYLEVKKSDVERVTLIINYINGEYSDSIEC